MSGLARLCGLAAAATLGLAKPPISSASERGWYAGLEYLDISAEYASRAVIPEFWLAPPTSQSLATHGLGSSGFKVVAGYRAFDWLAFEADYADLGGTAGTYPIYCVTLPCPNHFESATSAISESALGLYAFGRLDLFARVGIAHWRSSYELSDLDGAKISGQSSNDTSAFYGAGVQFHLRNLTPRLEYQKLRFEQDKAGVWSFGVTYTLRR